MNNPYHAFVNSPEMGRMMEVDGARIHYLEDGVGPPIVLLHPAGLSLFTFRRNIPFLSRYLRVLAPDLPGMGYSTLPADSPAGPEQMAKFLKGFLQNLSIDRAVLCGAGGGAIYALELACREPQMVSGLILASPGSLTRNFPREQRLLLREKLARPLLRFLKPAHIERYLRWNYFSEVNVDDYLIRQVWAPFEFPAVRQWLLRVLNDYDDSYALARMGSLSCPVRILWGADDIGRPCQMSELYHETIPNASVRILRNCGALPQEEKDREFNEEVVRLASLARPAPEPDLPDSPFYDGLD